MAQRGESLFGLARELVGGTVRLARLELQHGRQEVGQMVSETKNGAVLLGVAAGLFLLALISFVVFLILVIVAILPFLPNWLVAFLIFLVLAAVGVVLALRAKSHIRIGKPNETIDSVKEDIAWAKRLLRRD